MKGKPNRVLIFSSRKKLIAICQSEHMVAKAFKLSTQAIHYACTGRCMSSQGMYFRHLYDDIEVTLEDFDTLTVEEYDQLCGVERKVYKTRHMTRVGMKYNTKPKN